jgi:putative addiction module killer protein
MNTKNIVYYKADDGYIPFKEWFDGLKDKTLRVKIEVRLMRVMNGNFGDTHSLKNIPGLAELRFANGTRIYLLYAS